MSNFTYTGSELDLFAHAINWKSYWSSLIKDYLKGDVLEVGAGKGSNTRLLYSERFSRWVSLEPDYELAKHLRRSLTESPYRDNCEVINGTIASLSSGQMFDTIIYIDVLEHIEDDKEELKKASGHLSPGGNIIILSPALQVLFSEIDEAIGHFRRYTKGTIEKIVPLNLKVERLIYLDTVGLLVSMGNRILLKQRIPSLKQIRVWDSLIIPCSKHIDRLIGYSAGKSILAVLSLHD